MTKKTGFRIEITEHAKWDENMMEMKLYPMAYYAIRIR